MLIKITDGIPAVHPILESNFRQAFPGVSFPSPITPEDVQGYGYGVYERTNKPSVGIHEVAEEDLPTLSSNGIWLQTWKVRPMSEAEKQKVDEDKANEVRLLRTRDLTLSDWTQLADSPVNSADWGTYRQALRDIPSQPGFPWEITWPKEPV